MSDTPETDAAEYLISVGRKNDEWLVQSDFARKLERERDELRGALVSERALADRLAENLKIACHAWNNPTEHPAITDWRQSRHE
jgi:hypothetical protein